MTGAVKAPSQANYRPDIDGLRAISIILVLLYHFLPGRVPGGFIGVDIFFVISGYLITHQIVANIERKKFSIAVFYAHRARRILPALLIVLASSSVLAYFTLYADQLKDIGHQILAGTLFYANILFWTRSGYFEGANREQAFFHLWSLGAEEQFYIVFPVALFLLFKFRRRFDVILAILLLSFTANIILVRQHTSGVFYLLPTRAWELMAGAILSMMERGYGLRSLKDWLATGRERGMPAILAELLFAASIGIVIYLSVTLSDNSLFPGWYALGPTLAGFLVIGIRSGELKRVLLENRPMTWLGKISYPLYLWHVPVAYFFWTIYRDTHPSPGLGMTRFANGAMIPAISVVLAGITYEAVERPLRRRITNQFIDANLTRVLATSVASLALLVAIGTLLMKSPWINAAEKRLGERYGDAYITTFAGLGRTGKCLIPAGSPKMAFDSSCYRPGPAAKGRSVLIWGDSHAAALYPGLADYARQFDVFQLTSGCPPVLDIDVDEKRNCIERNKRVMEIIAETKPEIVILHARWALYPYRTPIVLSLQHVASLLKKVGVSQVIVVGPVPSWQPSLYKVIQRNYLHQGLPVTNYVAYGLEKSVLEMDRSLSQLRGVPDIVYVSVIEKMCRPTGCLAVLGDSVESGLVTWDYGHFTKAGSDYFAKNVLIAVLEQRPAP